MKRLQKEDPDESRPSASTPSDVVQPAEPNRSALPTCTRTDAFRYMLVSRASAADGSFPPYLIYPLTPGAINSPSNLSFVVGIERTYSLINIPPVSIFIYFPSPPPIPWIGIPFPLWSKAGLKGPFEAGFASRHIRLVFPSISSTPLICQCDGVQSLLFGSSGGDGFGVALTSIQWAPFVPFLAKQAICF